MSTRIFALVLGLCVLTCPPSSANTRWSFFFAPHSSSLTDEARNSMDEFLAEENGKCPLLVELVGYVDGAEARTAPTHLDIDRARAIAQEFRRLGATAWTIKAKGAHVSKQLEPTALGVGEELNRRVEVNYQRILANGQLDCEPSANVYPVPENVPVVPRCTLVLDDGTRCRGYDLTRW